MFLGETGKRDSQNIQRSIAHASAVYIRAVLGRALDGDV